jgi:hypothetical protein
MCREDYWQQQATEYQKAAQNWQKQATMYREKNERLQNQYQGCLRK